MLYIDKRVSPDKVLKLLKALKSYDTEVHQLVLMKDEEVLLELTPVPYLPTDKRVVFSVSKSFTSTAIGMCYDKGLLKPEDKVIDFFPKELTENADDRIKRLTIHNLLCMNTAMEDRMPIIERSGNPLESFFLSAPIKDTTNIYHYDNSASFMLAAVVKQVTGLNVIDLLNKDLFPYMNLSSCRWLNVDGISEGYSGLYTTARHIASLMQLYVNKGVFGGKRLLSEEWVNKATSVQISTEGDNCWRWWTQGYGYQFWMSDKEGCRAEGAIGQTGFIFPNLKVALAHTGSIKDFDKTHDAYYEFCSDFGGESVATEKDVEKYLNELYLPLAKSDKKFAGIGNVYKMDRQYPDLTIARFSEAEEEIVCEFSNDFDWQDIRLGKGKWVRNEIRCYNLIAGRVVCDVAKFQRTWFATCCEVMDENTLKIHLRFTDSPIIFEIILTIDGDKLSFKSCCTNFGEGGIKEYLATKI